MQASGGRSELQLGKPASAVEARLDQEADGSTLQVGKARARLPLRDARSLRSETVKLAGGHTVAVVYASDGSREAAAIVVRRASGAPEILWTGALFLAGDPGERRADALQVADRDGDGKPDLVVGVYDERIRLCGQERALLEPRALDPKTLTLRPVLLNRVDAKRPVEAIRASIDPGAPAPQGPPLLRSLHSTGASSTAAGSDVRSLTDGDPVTVWTEGRGLGGRFEFATLRWAAPDKPIRALALVLAPAAASGALSTVRRVSITPDQGPRLDVTLPEQSQPGQRLWIRPKSPMQASCLTLSFDDVSASKPEVHAALAELEAYTDLDFAGGLAPLVAEVIQDGPRAADATEWLQQARGDVLPQFSAAWSRMPSAAKRRALRVASARAATDDAATAFAAAAVRDKDREVAADALAVLVRQLPRSQPLLLEAAREPGKAGDEAALAVARSGDAAALRRLLDLLVSSPLAVERSGLRDAVAVAWRQVGPGAAKVVDDWLDQPALPIGARAAAGLALSGIPDAAASASQVLARSVEDARAFPERWRLTQASTRLAAEPKVDGWLAALAGSADEWMLRSAALEALAARGAGSALPAAKTALRDDYPRVRAQALAILANDQESLELLTRYARKDEWFLVRSAALQALPDGDASRATMQDALRDRSPIVRAAAIRALRRVRAGQSWSAVQPLVANAEEFPEVIADGIAYARALCLAAASGTLKDVVKRGLRPEAWTADQELALGALEALTHLGGEQAKWAQQHSNLPMVPASMRASAERAVTHPVPCRSE